MQENENRAPIPITTLIVHTKFHLDEAMALFLLTNFGEKFFPGVSKARVRFTQGLQKQADDTPFDQRKMLPLGCGGGRFDEHRGESERLPNECATTLVAKYLGVHEDPCLKRIIAEVLRCDTKAGVKSTELAEIIKMATRRLTENEPVLTWGMKVLHALHSHLFLNSDRVTGEKTLEVLFKDLVGKNRFPNEKARLYMEKLVRESMERKDDSIMELSFLTECLYRTDKDGDAVDFVRFALDHMYNDQLEFQKAVAECMKGEWFSFSALCNRKGRRERTMQLKGLIIKTDSPLVQRAARTQEAGGASVVIIQKTSGNNVSVFVDASKGINLTAFTRMVRWTELPKDEKESVSWENLGNAGVLPQVPNWYFFKKGQMLLNGSLSHTTVQPTSIHQDLLKETAKCAFHPDSIGRWMRSLNIPILRKGESTGKNVPASQPTPATTAHAKVKEVVTQATPTPPQTPTVAKVGEVKEELTEAERMRKELERALNGNQIKAA